MDENDISQIQRNTDVMSNRHSSVFGDCGIAGIEGKSSVDV